jgi:DNA-binding XRE family transcriptional regulator
MAILPAMLEQARIRAGWSVGQAAWRLGVSVREYRGLDAGERWPNWETFHRVCELYGWTQSFVSSILRSDRPRIVR